MLKHQEKDLIMIVEDDHDISEMLCAYLRTKQFRSVATPMGKDVLELCRQERPNLILLDINLPDIDGFEVCRRLRANLATSNLPIIFVSQKADREARIAAFENGGNDYITKPFDMEELYLRVSNTLRLQRYRACIDNVSGLPSGPLVEEQLKTLLHRRNWALVLITVKEFEHFEYAYSHLKDKFAAYVAQLVRRGAQHCAHDRDVIALGWKHDTFEIG